MARGRSIQTGIRVDTSIGPRTGGARNGLTWSEALALVHDRVVINDWIGTGAAVALLEHEQHAVVGFCLEVQAAWNRCRERLGLDSGEIEPAKSVRMMAGR